MDENSIDEPHDDWETRFYRAFPTLKNLLDFHDSRFVGFKVAILLRDFIRTEVQTARDETTREITDAISSHAAYLSPIEGDLMHNAAVEYLKQFRREEN